MNGFLCFLEDEWQRKEKEEREEMPLQGEDESRRSSLLQEAMDKSLEEEVDE